MSSDTQIFAGKKTQWGHASIRFLERIEGCFLLQTLDTPTKGSTLLHLLLTNWEWEDFLDNVSTMMTGSLGYSDHKIEEFMILLSTLKTSSRTKTLNYRTANFNMLRVLLQGISWKASMEWMWAWKELVSTGSYWELLRVTGTYCLLQAQEQSLLYKGKGRRLN